MNETRNEIFTSRVLEKSSVQLTTKNLIKMAQVKEKLNYIYL